MSIEELASTITALAQRIDRLEGRAKAQEKRTEQIEAVLVAAAQSAAKD